MSPYNLTFIANVADVLNPKFPVPNGYTFKSALETHSDQLAELWFSAFPPEIATDYEAAQEEMQNMFTGEYGKLWPDASLLAFEDNKLVAALCTVHKAPWDATPTCPFIIDMMVDPNSRRKGLAKFLIQETCRLISKSGISHVALRVLTKNKPAIKLYRKLGFVEWDGKLFAPK